MRLTKKERLKDEQVLAAIIAASEECGRPVRPHVSHDGILGSYNGFGVQPEDSQEGACCAVGAGILYRGLDLVDEPLTEFARLYGVSLDYAIGVSRGFESELDDLTALIRMHPKKRCHYLFSRDLRRGIQVGKAAFEALFTTEVQS